MYKAGKKWMFAAITAISLGAGLGIGTYPAQASSVNSPKPVIPAITAVTNNNLPNSTPSYQNRSTQLSSSSKAWTSVTPANFKDYFSLSGSAALPNAYNQSNGVLTITPKDAQNQDGNFSLNSKIDMNTSFTLTGKINLGNKTSSQGGADGIGLAFHTGNTNDLGNAGANLGIGGLPNAIGFKLDTYHNDPSTPQANENGAKVAPTDSNGYGWATDPDSTKFPQFGAFVNTSQKLVQAQDGKSYPRWWATTDMNSVQKLNSGDLDGNFHDFVVSYDGSNRKLTIKYTETGENVLTWSTVIPPENQSMAMDVSASTGGNTNLQQFEISSFDFKQAATVNVKYVDQKGNRLDQGTVSYPSGADVNNPYDTLMLDIPNYIFIKMSDSDITGGNSLPASGTLKNPGDNGTVIYVYVAVGKIIPVDSNGKQIPGAEQPKYINDPKDPTKVAPNEKVPALPGKTPRQASVTPVNPTKDTKITYTADKQKGSVSYVDDTTGKTLKTDSISGHWSLQSQFVSQFQPDLACNP